MKRELNTMSKDKYFSLLKAYMAKEFINFIGNKDFLETWEEPLAILLLCNNTNKTWPSTEGLNFTLIREVLYNFKLKTMNSFLKMQQNAFLYEFYFETAGEKEANRQKEIPSGIYFEEMHRIYLLCGETIKEK